MLNSLTFVPFSPPLSIHIAEHRNPAKLGGCEAGAGK